MDQGGDTRNEETHGDRQWVDQEGHVYVDEADVDPVKEVNSDLTVALVQQPPEGGDARDE